MEFKSYADLMQFESEREKYYIDLIQICRNPFKFYARLFLDFFSPECRMKKKLYDGYQGGYWRDENGFLNARHIEDIPMSIIHDGDICIEREKETVYAIYVKRGNVFYNIVPK